MENGTIGTELDGQSIGIAAFSICAVIDGRSVLYNAGCHFFILDEMST